MNIDRYHEDEIDRIENERHAGIVIRNGKLLLMHRIRKGYEYYVFPGGHRRNDEPGEEATIREVWEETGIKVEKPRLVFEFREGKNDKAHYYYECIWKEGDEPRLEGEEKYADPKINLFEPMWVDLDLIPDLNILPGNAKEWIRDNLNTLLKNK